ncbi:MAG TPA: c-type cytochrome [Flavobacterium sp.]|jgi:cytochrome c
MKALSSFILLAMLFTSCKKEESKKEESFANETEAKTPVDLGQELFEGSGKCFSCHNPDQSIVGPSIIKITQIYKDQNADIVSFLKGEADPIVDPTQYEVMKTNLEITKRMTDDELKAIEAYMFSHLK